VKDFARRTDKNLSWFARKGQMVSFAIKLNRPNRGRLVSLANILFVFMPMRFEITFHVQNTFKFRNERVLTNIGMFIPRKNRMDVIADLEDDMAEWREDGRSEPLITFLILWHIALHSGKLTAAAAFSALGAAFAFILKSIT